MSSDTLTITIDEIITEGRYRPEDEFGNMEEFCGSVARLGLIHPIVLSRRPDGKYDLIAGGRRTRALKLLGKKTLYHNSVLDPERPGFLFKDEVPEDVRKEAELEENLYRLNVTWVADCLAVSDIHLAKKKNNIRWGEAQTAAILGRGYSRVNVNYTLLVAKLVRAGDKEILSCTTLYEANLLRLKRREEQALAELQKRVSTGSKVVTLTSPLVTTGSPESLLSVDATTSVLDSFNLQLGPKKTFSLPTSDPLKAATDQIASVTDTVPEVPLSKMFLLGDSITSVMPNYPPACFDHIVTDIPYGIDMDNLTEKGLSDVAEQHDVQQNVDMMLPFLTQAFRLVRPHGFCVFFYDLDHHEKLQTWATQVGWKVQSWPLVWIKTHPCKNQAPAYNYTKTFEVAMVLRRSESAVLRKPQTQSHWVGDGSAERKLYNNKFAKPSALWRELIYDAIAFTGQSVYDPFWGEGSSSRPAANMGLLPYGSEISPTHFNRGYEAMKGIYSLIHKSNVKFT